jgi:hypothetical protein
VSLVSSRPIGALVRSKLFKAGKHASCGLVQPLTQKDRMKSNEDKEDRILEKSCASLLYLRCAAFYDIPKLFKAIEMIPMKFYFVVDEEQVSKQYINQVIGNIQAKFGCLENDITTEKGYIYIRFIDTFNCDFELRDVPNELQDNFKKLHDQ